MSNARNLARLLPNASGQLPDAAMSSGSVLQVVSAINTTDTVISTNVLVDFITASITPIRADSKILALCTFASVGKAAYSSEGYFALFRDGSQIALIDGISPYNASGSFETVGSVSCCLHDSPSTTNTVTYKMRVKDDQSAGIRINWEGGYSSLVLLEIAG